MVISVLELVPDCNSRDSGKIVGEAIQLAFLADGNIKVCFAGVEDVPSAFVNLAFVPLLEQYALPEIRRRLQVVNSTRQINEMIKRRLEFEAGRRKKRRTVGQSAFAAE